MEEMKTDSKDSLSQLDSLLASSHQSWLFGAGISLDAGIPLMADLTDRIFQLAKEKGDENDEKLLNSIKNELSDDAHIEHILSHLGDHRAIAARSKSQKCKFGEIECTLEKLDNFHQRILQWIAETIRWGYKAKSHEDEEEIGSADSPIVRIDAHQNFIDALLEQGQAGLAERRGAVRLFTTNYDTLLEDALALQGYPYWDGFSGGAVAYRSYRYGEDEPKGFRAHVIKLHGSIDWHLGCDGKTWRVRENDTYPEKSQRVLIYPQSIKYLATQRDPFAAQFDLFRRALAQRDENVLIICGYSFGDEHINEEIELSLAKPENKTTVIAFSKELNSTLQEWRKSSWSKRLYIISRDGLYVGNSPVCLTPKDNEKHDWWKFQEMTKILKSGTEAYTL